MIVGKYCTYTVLLERISRGAIFANSHFVALRKVKRWKRTGETLLVSRATTRRRRRTFGRAPIRFGNKSFALIRACLLTEPSTGRCPNADGSGKHDANYKRLHSNRLICSPTSPGRGVLFTIENFLCRMGNVRETGAPIFHTTQRT